MTYDLSSAVRRLAISLCFLSATLVLSGGTTPAAAQVGCPQAVAAGAPVVNNQHIFCGQITPQLAASGFHSRPGGANPASIAGGAVAAIPLAPAGIYRITNFNITEGLMTYVKAFSTMFPDACNQAAVIAAIRNALAAGAPVGGGGAVFVGPSGAGCQAGAPPAPFNIRVILNGNGDIVTAYPNY